MTLKHVEDIDIDYTSGSRPFLLVTTKDGKIYQIKPPGDDSTIMFKEYLANKIAEKASILTPDGCFIYFEEEDLKFHISELNEYFKVDISDFKNSNDEIILFGVEWLEGKEVPMPNTNDGLYKIFDLLATDNLYATFSFDQLLYNLDRLKGNILLCTNEASDSDIDVYLIDHDRIFGYRNKTNIEQINNNKKLFGCLRFQETDYLYRYILKPIQKDKILMYIKNLTTISNKDLLNIFEDYQLLCPDCFLTCDNNKESIISFITYRLSQLELKCSENLKRKCYG